ncbi:putative transmembrane protein [Cryptosporidium felis]|nr:putative transmembrane protein [Cryptosporidium felis]
MEELKGIRVLYLHGLYDNYRSYRKKQIEEIVGVSYIRSPDMRYSHMVTRSKTGYVGVSFLVFVALIIGLKIVLPIITVSLITGMVVLRRCANFAKEMIEKNILAFKPEIIVTSDFSAVGMCMVNSRISRVPVIMFSPSILNFKKFTISRLELDPTRFQCLMIVQSLNDRIVPTRDIMELISGLDEKQVRTHFLQGVGSLLPTYASVSSEQLATFMTEILQMASEDGNGTENETEFQKFSRKSDNLEKGVNKLVSSRLQTMHTVSDFNYGINLPTLRKPVPAIKKSSRNKLSRHKSLGQELEESGYNLAREPDENEQSPLITHKSKASPATIYNPKPNSVNELFNNLESIIEDESSENNSEAS